jgi:hypothetical protein
MNPEEVKDMIEQSGGKIDGGGLLPDGSGFLTASFPLPKDHWIYGDKEAEGDTGYEAPPMVLRIGTEEVFTGNGLFLTAGIQNPVNREGLESIIRRAGKYAVRSATMKGKEMDFDPDALLQNLVTGFLGYNTADGLSSDEWANPKVTK